MRIDLQGGHVPKPDREGLSGGYPAAWTIRLNEFGMVFVVSLVPRDPPVPFPLVPEIQSRIVPLGLRPDRSEYCTIRPRRPPCILGTPRDPEYTRGPGYYWGRWAYPGTPNIPGCHQTL